MTNRQPQKLTPIQFGVFAQVRAALVDPKETPAGIRYTTREHCENVDVTKQVNALLRKGYVQIRENNRLAIEGDAEWISQ